MEGVQSRAARPSMPGETVLISCAESGRHVAAAAARVLEQQHVVVQYDQKLSDPGDQLPKETLAKIRESDVLVLALGDRCQQKAWLDREARAAFDAGKPVLLFLESRAINWFGAAVPTLVTDQADRLGAFMARSRPDSMSIWEFAKTFFTDHATARLFKRSNPQAWRWERKDLENASAEFGLSLADDVKPASPEIRLIEARVQDGETMLLIGTTDWKRYRFAYSRDIRGIIPAPVFPGAPPIGFMHCDFDTGREWARAGEPPVEIRLLGRDVYGWHMSEFFWKAFVGSLPKMLGQTS